MRPALKYLLLPLACLATAAAARPLADMTESGTFIICAAPEQMPFSRKGPAPAGLYIDLGALLARELGLTLEVRWVPGRNQLRRVQCDAVMGAALLKPGATSMRSVLTIPYMHALAVVIAGPKVKPIAELEQLRDYRVAVPSGSWAHKHLNERAIPVWVRFRNDDEIIGAVRRGDADGGVVSNLAIGWHQKVHGEDGIRVFDRLLDDGEFGFDVAIELLDTDKAAVDKVNAALAARLRDGAIGALGAAYGGYRPPEREK